MAKRCKRCHRMLRDDESLSRGYGPTCFRILFTPAKRAGKDVRKKKTAARHTDAGDDLGPLFQVGSYHDLLEYLKTTEVIDE